MLALAAVVLAPAAAQAGTLELVRLGSFFDRWTYTAGADQANTITILAGDATRFVLRDAGEVIEVADPELCPAADCGCTGGGTDTVTCPRFGGLVVSSGNRNDDVRADPGLPYNLSLQGGAGVDRLQGGAGADEIDGGSGADPELTGQGGDDQIRGGLGADTGIAGGPGTDTLSYDDRRTAGVTVSLATGANGDGDVFTEMEGVEGSPHTDTLVGSRGADVVTGLAGDDTLAGGDGPDVLRGGDGNDTVDALDRVPDQLDCGEGGDVADLDLTDVQVGCEVARRPDSDADGFDDGADCDSADPAVNPAAAEVPDNAVDENCDGLVAVSPPPDRDGDGVDATQDCDDGNGAVRPGATEVRGNTVDEDCDGARPDFRVVGATITVFVRSTPRWSRVTELTIARIPAGGRVELRCRPPQGVRRACPFRRITRTFASGRRTLSLRAAFKGRHLPRGTVLDIRVLAPGRLGRVRIERIGKSKTTRRLRCLRPGAAQPERCPAAR